MKPKPVTIRMATTGDLYDLCNVAADIFDNKVDPDLAREYLHDPRHHLAIALVDGQIIGMASAVHYIHPDKNPELFINEAGVDKSVRGNGIG
ncbi:MAG: GNAT family N-acetyltransferase, partial [Pyrinomonadaceae bacterium]|nr:GNAT family N-acetyltransferase [Pyrinomonadaceae bacterium]